MRPHDPSSDALSDDPHLSAALDVSAAHLRMARAGLGLTVRDLALLANVNKATVVRAEAGLQIRAGSLAALRNALESKGAFFVRPPGTQDILVGVRTVLKN